MAWVFALCHMADNFVTWPSFVCLSLCSAAHACESLQLSQLCCSASWCCNRNILLQILQSLEVGDFVEVKGPIGHFHYSAPGHFTNHKAHGETNKINMIAGGTGITPMYQVTLDLKR